jgi:hypothetical protein
LPASSEDQRFVQQSATVFHPINEADKTAMAGLRAIIVPDNGQLRRNCSPRALRRFYQAA